MAQTFLARISNIAKLIKQHVHSKIDSFSIDSPARLQEFVSTRSAWVGQKKLYGYVKQRAGTRWPTLFEDETFKQSLQVSSVQVYAACLSDLTIYAVATALQGETIKDAERAKCARQIFALSLADNEAASDVQGFDAKAFKADFTKRLHDTDWNFGALQPENFTRSKAALVRWAPIADELKNRDIEIIENSIKFAWVDIRRDFSKRLDAPAIQADIAHWLAKP